MMCNEPSSVFPVDVSCGLCVLCKLAQEKVIKYGLYFSRIKHNYLLSNKWKENVKKITGGNIGWYNRQVKKSNEGRNLVTFVYF